MTWSPRNRCGDGDDDDDNDKLDDDDDDCEKEKDKLEDTGSEKDLAADSIDDGKCAFLLVRVRQTVFKGSEYSFPQGLGPAGTSVRINCTHYPQLCMIERFSIFTSVFQLGLIVHHFCLPFKLRSWPFLYASALLEMDQAVDRS